MKTKSQAPQKKRTLLTCIYALIVGLLILACAIIIATVSTKQKLTNQEVTPGDETLDVSASTYVVPVQNGTIVKDYSGTKLQYNDSLKQWEIHKAVDFVVEGNTQVVSIANGTVTEVYTNHLEGTVVKIAHADGLVSVYKSLDKNVNVKVGDTVSAGTVIGNASNTMAEELNTGVHLHLELLLNGVKVDPNNYLSLGNK